MITQPFSNASTPEPGRPTTISEYVTAHARDLERTDGEALIGQVVVVGGLFRRFGQWRTPPQRPGEAGGQVDILEIVDVTGSILVRVPTERDISALITGQLVLVAGEVTPAAWPFGLGVQLHGGWSWEQAAALGPEEFGHVAQASAPWHLPYFPVD